MPLASSRTATAKAAQDRRMSLPATIDSSTRVTRTKAMKRRASLRSSSNNKNSRTNDNKENNKQPPLSPGPTPYWRVAEERDAGASPRMTRSATKRHKPRLPPFAHHSANTHGGEMLSFSPPDQEANRLREERELERKERERAWRVEQARRNGQLLVFSPGGTSSYLEPLPAAGRPSNAADGDQVASELKNIRETMNKLLEAKSNEQNAASAEILQAEKLAIEAQVLRSEHLAALNSKLETASAQLHTDVKELETKLATEKEAFLVEKTRLEGEIDASKREATTRIQGLEETRKQLSDQVTSMQKEKTSLIVRVTDLEMEVNLGREKVAELSSAIQTLRSDSKAELDSLKQENERLLTVEGELSAKLADAKRVQDDLERKATEYEEALDSLENQLLPESESQLKNALDKLRAQKTATSEAEEKLSAATEEIEQMKADIEALEQEKDEERVQFQALNEESTKSFTKLKGDAAEKEQKIDSLSQQLFDMERQLADEKADADAAAEEFSRIQTDMESQMKELGTSVEDLRSQLQSAYDEKRQLSSDLDNALKQIDSLSNAKKEALTEYSSASANLDEVQKSLANEKDANQRLQNEGRDQQLRIMELEKQLKNTGEQRDDALNRMGSFDDREEELYRKLRESDRIRRDLHNRVMQLSGNIRVYVRVRPALEGEVLKQQLLASSKTGLSDKTKKRKHEAIDEEENPFHFPGVYDRDDASSKSKKARSSVDDLCKNIIEVTEPLKDRGGLKPRQKQWRFGFDHVFSPMEGQEDVWGATEPLVQSAVDGFNVCIFAYGQTGSGKTYTMIGEPGNEGIISRSVTKLFESKREMEALSRGETQVNLCVELLEIYNEQVRDLLAPNSGPNGREVNLKVTSKEVVGNIVVGTSTKEDVMDVLELAQKRRCVKATKSNSESSRSHMLFTIHFNVETKDGVSRTGKLHVCDLAGSERLNKSGAAVAGGALLTETKNINQSLSVLSNVIERLQAGSPNIPYRESKLTFLLQNSLGGNSKTLAIVCCNPLASHFHESLCSLRFAEKVNKVDLKAVANFSC